MLFPMLTRLAIVLCAALLPGGSTAAMRMLNTPAKGIEAPPSMPISYMRPAIDHVVTYAFWRGFGRKGGDRITVWRHGNLVRETTDYIGSKRAFEPAEETSYSNLATHASFSGKLGGPGQISGFTIWGEKHHTVGRYDVMQTGEMRKVAGERCGVWRAKNLDDRGVPSVACITADGVVLYNAYLAHDGSPFLERTAIKVERRRVELSEVLPPKRALDFASWLKRVRAAASKPTGRPPNYDLQLKRGTRLNLEELAERERDRASGGWAAAEKWQGGQLQGFSLRHSSGELTLTYGDGTLSVSYSPTPRGAPLDMGVAPLKKAAETVLGERCAWFDTARNVTDYWRAECRSRDGLPLIILENSWGSPLSEYRAASVTRGKTALRDVMPPARLFDWSAWGWPELQR